MIESRLGKEHHLVKVYHLLDWGRFGRLLSCVYERSEPVAGVIPYDPVKMFRVMILQAWHSLSDPKMEEALKVRLDFMWFAGFDVGDDVPDETSICRFRNRLVAKDLDSRLFAELNEQLIAHNIMVEHASAAIIDASVIESAARPKQTVYPMPEDRKEDETPPSIIKQSADPDAAWLKKGKRSHFGYKLFAVVDEDGFARHGDMTSANQSETTYFETIVTDMPKHEGMRVYSDKGNASQSNRNLLKHHKLKDGIMHKAARNRPLTSWEKIKNHLISSIRYIVEQGFGTLKRPLDFSRASYFGLERVKGQAFRKMICLNLIKAANMIELLDTGQHAIPSLKRLEAI
ncbi:IS5 family transposase [Mariprofundus erugo]|uniref:IS5 family transposase n=1 Tax=Mariprofundus erugo TaxID=2528639 RepID=UPI001EE963E8|nr:IS5 family transposase [Mariprofundus erugo]